MSVQALLEQKFATIPELIAAHAAARPAHAALIQGEARVDYAALDQLMDRVGASLQRDAPNIGREFRELRLIELVPASIQSPHNGMRQDPAIALEMLERDLRIVSAVEEIERGHVTEPHPKIRR